MIFPNGNKPTRNCLVLLALSISSLCNGWYTAALILHPPMFSQYQPICHGRLLSENLVMWSKKAKKRRSPSKSKQGRPRENHREKEEIEEMKVSQATGLVRASLAGVLEDHNYEQFFYSKQSSQQIYQYVTQYSYPLLLCNPSLAVLAHEDSSNPNYLLLDRDKRFQFLTNYQEFDLMQPSLVGNNKYLYDAVFIDPPFANITPDQLVSALRLMATTEERLQADVYIAYNSRREEELITAFGELSCPPLQRLWPLQYESVRDGMQDKIFLYGPMSRSKFNK